MLQSSRPTLSFRRSAFTLVELLVVIAIIVLLASILLPSVNSMMARGRSTKCISNLRQIGVGMISYSSEHNGLLPHAYTPANGDTLTWMQKTAPYLGMADNAMGSTPLPRAAGVFICPEWTMTTNRAVSYGLNPLIDPTISYYSWNYRPLNTSQTGTFLVVEIAVNDELGPTDGVVSMRHPPRSVTNTSANYLFVDGHVENIQGLVPPTDPRWTQKK